MAEYTKNSPKVLNADGKPLVPGTYEIEKIALKRADLARELDITRLITDMTITEELFSPVMVVKMTVSDTANSEDKIFKTYSEYFQGHEVIEISLRFIDINDSKTIKFECGVRDYSDFELDNEGLYTGTFVITAVDNFAILSRFQQISFGVGQPHDDSKRGKTTIEHIALIFKKYLKLNDSSFDYSTSFVNTICDTRIRAVIPYCTPLQAIEWLRLKSFDKDKSPFFVYGIFNNLNNKPIRKIMMKSWNWLINRNLNQPYRKFVKKYNDETYSDDNSRYNFEKQRLLEFTTDTTKNELNKFLQGEYNTIVKTIDYAGGVFDYDDNVGYVPSLEQSLTNTLTIQQYKNRFDKNKRLRDSYIETLKLSSRDIAIYEPAIVSHKSQPLYDNSGDLTDATQIRNWHSRTARFFSTKIDNEQSEIVVYGDINLNPGKILEIIVDKDSIKSSRNSFYIIIASVHSFVDGRYINRLRIVQLPKNNENR
jgi:hypothetical protein